MAKTYEIRPVWFIGLVLCLCLFERVTFCQSVIRLSNIGQPPRSETQPILDAGTGLPIAGPGFTAQLYWANQAPNSQSELSATDNVTGFVPDPVGILFPDFGVIPAEPGTYWFQIRVWENSFGDSFEVASGQAGAKVGQSNIFTAQTVRFGADFPVTLAEAGMESFSVAAVNPIPEPSSIVLCLLGGGVILLRRNLRRA